MLKIVNWQNCHKIILSELEKVGRHRYPPGSEGEDTIQFVVQGRETFTVTRQDQIRSGDYAKTLGGGGTSENGHGTNTHLGTIWNSGQCHARIIVQGPHGCNKLRGG
jgi:hypothetical protein